MVIIFRDFLMFDQIFLSPQIKRSVIINNKHGIYELPHGLPNDLRRSILRNWEILGKSQNSIDYSLVHSPPPQNEYFFNTSKKPLKNRN